MGCSSSRGVSDPEGAFLTTSPPSSPRSPGSDASVSQKNSEKRGWWSSRGGDGEFEMPSISASPTDKFYVHILDYPLAKKCIRSAVEYFSFALRFLKSPPSSSEEFKKYWGLEQPDWADAFRNMSIIQFVAMLVYVCVNPVLQMIMVGGVYFSFLAEIPRVGMTLVQGVLFAHMGWYGVVKEQGCCLCMPCCCFCFKAKCLLLVWTVLGSFVAFNDLFWCLMYPQMCAICFILIPLPAFYDMTMLYLAFCCFKLWKQHGYPTLDGKVGLVGPDGMPLGRTYTLTV